MAKFKVLEYLELSNGAHYTVGDVVEWIPSDFFTVFTALKDGGEDLADYFEPLDPTATGWMEQAT